MSSSDETTLPVLSQSIRSAAIAAGAYLLETVPANIDESRALVARIDADDALKLIAKTTPRIIYLLEEQFDVDGQIENALSELGDRTADEITGEIEAPLRNDARLISFAKRWHRYDRELSTVFVAFMADGILHTAVSTPTWSDEFDAALEDIAETLEQEASEQQSVLDSTDSQDVREKAVTLAAHPSFSAKPVSFEKRLFLAEQLFQNFDQKKLERITTRAVNLDWLTKSGSVTKS